MRGSFCQIFDVVLIEKAVVVLNKSRILGNLPRLPNIRWISFDRSIYALQRSKRMRARYFCYFLCGRRMLWVAALYRKHKITIILDRPLHSFELMIAVVSLP